MQTVPLWQVMNGERHRLIKGNLLLLFRSRVISLQHGYMISESEFRASDLRGAGSVQFFSSTDSTQPKAATMLGNPVVGMASSTGCRTASSHAFAEGAMGVNAFRAVHA